jgi:hypothetical protein
MKTIAHEQLFGSPKSIRKTEARIARAKLIMTAAEERAAEMAQTPALRKWRITEAQKRRLAQVQSS